MISTSYQPILKVMLTLSVKKIAWVWLSTRLLKVTRELMQLFAVLQWRTLNQSKAYFWLVQRINTLQSTDLIPVTMKLKRLVNMQVILTLLETYKLAIHCNMYSAVVKITHWEYGTIKHVLLKSFSVVTETTYQAVHSWMKTL